MRFGGSKSDDHGLFYLWEARCPSGRVSDSGARGREFDLLLLLLPYKEPGSSRNVVGSARLQHGN